MPCLATWEIGMIDIGRAVREAERAEQEQRVDRRRRALVGRQVRQEKSTTEKGMPYAKHRHMRSEGRTIPSGISYHSHKLLWYLSKIK